jgi:hypothetical protein
MLLSLTFTLSGFTFSAQVLHPLLPLRRMMALPGAHEMMLYVHALLIASVLIQIMLKLGAVLLAMRRWRLPPGSLTLVFALNGLLMCTLDPLERLRLDRPGNAHRSGGRRLTLPTPAHAGATMGVPSLCVRHSCAVLPLLFCGAAAHARLAVGGREWQRPGAHSPLPGAPYRRGQATNVQNPWMALQVLPYVLLGPSACHEWLRPCPSWCSDDMPSDGMGPAPARERLRHPDLGWLRGAPVDAGPTMPVAPRSAISSAGASTRSAPALS